MAKKKQKIVEEQKPKVWNIRIVHTCEVYDNDDGDESEEQYSYRGTTSTSHYVHGFNVVDDKTYNDLYASFEPKPETDYYLLYAIYSTGDSFGHDDGHCIEYFGLYEEKDLEIAKADQKKLETFERTDSERLCKLSNQSVYLPWNGYFESLDSVELEKVRLSETDMYGQKV